MREVKVVILLILLLIVAMTILLLGWTYKTPPKAVISVSHATVPINGVFQLSGRLSFDPKKKGSVAKYEWDFGDKTTAIGETVSHSYASGGDYKVTLTVTDNRGGTASTSIIVFAVYDYY